MNHALCIGTQKAAEFNFEGDLDLAPIRPAIKLLGNYSAQLCNPLGRRPAGQQTEGEGECPLRLPFQLWAEGASLNPVDKAPFDRVQGPRAAGSLYWQPERLFGEMEKLVSAASVLQRG